MAITRKILILGRDRRFEDRELHAGLDDVRIVDHLLIGLPNFWPRERIVIDLRLFRNVPKTIAVFAPGAYGVGHVGWNHTALHYHEVGR